MSSVVLRAWALCMMVAAVSGFVIGRWSKRTQMRSERFYVTSKWKLEAGSHTFRCWHDGKDPHIAVDGFSLALEAK